MDQLQQQINTLDIGTIIQTRVRTFLRDDVFRTKTRTQITNMVDNIIKQDGFYE